MLGALMSVSVLSVVALPAEASTAYRYWSYWNAGPGTTQWQYATEGSGTFLPDDGAVEGWRFGIADEAARIQPDTVPDFDAICAGVARPADGKRVALVLDPGIADHAPSGEAPGQFRTACVTTSTASTGLQILQSIATVRMDAGFVCGIDGYPSVECAPLVEVPDTSVPNDEVPIAAQNVSTLQTSESNRTAATNGSPIFTVVTLVALALLGLGIWRLNRRRGIR